MKEKLPRLDPSGRIAHDLCQHKRGQQAEQAHHDGKQYLWQSLLFQSSEELRTDTIPYGKQEHQKKYRFQRSSDIDMQLSDQYTDQQDAGYPFLT